MRASPAIITSVCSKSSFNIHWRALYSGVDAFRNSSADEMRYKTLSIEAAASAPGRAAVGDNALTVVGDMEANGAILGVSCCKVGGLLLFEFFGAYSTTSTTVRIKARIQTSASPTKILVCRVQCAGLKGSKVKKDRAAAQVRREEEPRDDCCICCCCDADSIRVLPADATVAWMEDPGVGAAPARRRRPFWAVRCKPSP